MLIHNRLESSEVNGPGKRTVIWFQGCQGMGPRGGGCPGCWNPDTHLFDISKQVPLPDMIDWVLSRTDIEGVTFSGGEPMQQAAVLYLLMAKVREKRPELSFGMYSGYTLKELEEGRFKWMPESSSKWVKGSRELWSEVKKHLDFAVLGRYNQLVRSPDNSKALIGSLNQEIVFFTDRYKESDLQPGYEVTIEESGDLVQITGFPVNIL